MTCSMLRNFVMGSAFLIVCFSLAGCGSSESGTKLPEAEQQKQKQELNQQRDAEWKK